MHDEHLMDAIIRDGTYQSVNVCKSEFKRNIEGCNDKILRNQRRKSSHTN